MLLNIVILHSINLSYKRRKRGEDMTRRIEEKKFASFLLKVPIETWNKLKIKSITENSPTYRDTLLHLIDEYVKDV